METGNYDFYFEPYEFYESTLKYKQVVDSESNLADYITKINNNTSLLNDASITKLSEIKKSLSVFSEYLINFDTVLKYYEYAMMEMDPHFAISLYWLRETGNELPDEIFEGTTSNEDIVNNINEWYFIQQYCTAAGIDGSGYISYDDLTPEMVNGIKEWQFINAFCAANNISNKGYVSMADIDDKEFRKNLVAWMMLNNSEVQKDYGINCETLDQLLTEIATLDEKMKKLREEIDSFSAMCDEGSAMIQIIYYILNNYQGYCYDFDKIASECVVGYTYIASSGETKFVYYWEAIPTNVDMSKVKYITFEEQFGKTDLYNSVAELAKEEPWFSNNLPEDITDQIATKQKEHNDQIAKLEKEYADTVARRNLLENLHNTIVTKAQQESDFILEYTLRDDFSENCVIDALPEVNSNLSVLMNIYNYTYSDDVDSMVLENNSNIKLDEISGQRYLTVNDQDMMMDVIYSLMFSNDFEYFGNSIYFSPDGNDANRVYVTSNDDTLKNFVQWIPLMTEEEKSVFSYQWNTGGKTAAYEYLQAVSDMMDDRWVADKTQKDQEFAAENPVLASVASVIVTPFEGMAAMINSVDSLLTGEEIRQTFTYSSGNVMRQQVSLDISQTHGEGWAFLYNTGMSVADSAVLLALNTATMGTMTPFLSFTLMGSRSYVSTINDALDRGLSDGEAVALAFSATAAETICETVSVGKLLNLETSLNSVLGKSLSMIDDPTMHSICKVFGGAVLQGISEGEEEFATEILNAVFDGFISGENSAYVLAVEGYKKNGYSDEEAIALASKDFAGQCTQAFLGGFLSGGFNGGVFTTASTVSENVDISNITKAIMQDFNDSSFNVDAKNIRMDMRHGNYDAALSQIFNAENTDLSSKIVAGKMLCDSILSSYQLDDIQSKNLVDTYNNQVEQFLSLDTSEQISQFNNLDSNKKVILYGELKSSGKLDQNTDKLLFTSVASDLVESVSQSKLENGVNVDSQIQSSVDIDSLKYGKVSTPQYILDYLASNVRKYAYKNTNSFEGLNESIMQNGLYHFTDAADAIIDSGYIKASNMSASYGNKKTFFFNGVPDVGAFATNLDSIPVKTVAVKVNPTSELVNSSKLKLRYIDDMAITYDGKFDLTGFEVEKCYFGLVVENGKLVYKQISESEYNSYENTTVGRILTEYTSNKGNVKNIKASFLVDISERNKNNKAITDSDIGDLADDSDVVWYEEDESVDIDEVYENGVKPHIGIQFFAGKNDISTSDVQNYYNDQVKMANHTTVSKGRIFTFDVDNFADIPSDFWSKIYAPSMIYFRKDGKLYSFADAKELSGAVSLAPVNDTFDNTINVDGKNTINYMVSSMGELNARKALWYAATGNMSYIPSEFLSQVQSMPVDTINDFLESYGKTKFSNSVQDESDSDIVWYEEDEIAGVDDYDSILSERNMNHSEISVVFDLLKNNIVSAGFDAFRSSVNALTDEKYIDLLSFVVSKMDGTDQQIEQLYYNLIDEISVDRFSTAINNGLIKFSDGYYSDMEISVGNGKTILMQSLLGILSDDDTCVRFLDAYKNGRQFFMNYSNQDILLGLSALDYELSKIDVSLNLLTDNQRQIYELSLEYEPKNIKDEILSNMPEGLSDLEKCRYCYMELNKRVSYEYGYFSFDRNSEEQRNYYSQNVTFDTLTSNKVICKGWSQLYRELLLEVGLSDAVKIMIRGGYGNGTHKWVEIEFADYILRADATDAFNHSVDISASKSGSSTNGFIIISKELAGVNLNTKKDEQVIIDGQVMYQRISTYDKLQIDDSWLREIDNKLGYAKNGKYFDEIVNGLATDFYSPGIVEKIFGLNQDKLLNAKYDYFLNLDISENMNAYDAYVYLSQVKHALFGKDSAIEVSISYRASKDSSIPVGAVSIVKAEAGNIVCKIIDDELGIMNLKFNNMHEYVAYINELGYFNRNGG